MKLANVPFRLTRLYISVFLTQVSLSIAFLATPILALEMKASPFLIGLIGASTGGPYAIMTFFFGSASDRFSRKRLLTTATLVQAFAMILCFISQNPYQLILARFVFAIGAALYWPLAEAYTGDLAGAGQLNQALTGYNVSWSLATIVGPQIGGLLITWFLTRTPLLVALILFVFAGMLFLPKTAVKSARSHSTHHLNQNEERVLNNPKISPLIYAFLYAFTGALLNALFPAYATQLNISADLIGLMFLLSGLAQTITILLSSRLLSKLGTEKLLLLSALFLCISLTIISFTLAIPIFMVGFLILGFGQGMAYSTAILLVLKRSSSRRGKAAGMFEGILGVGFFAGPLVGGVLYQVGGSHPYLLGAFASLLMVTSQLFLMLKQSRVKQ
ncbi:MAG: MFS transporter [Candidatus Bathyarchaeota archaeon]|nr:MAG: MFS transporter [Candidatus Bathyarchaeota archaeon]